MSSGAAMAAANCRSSSRTDRRRPSSAVVARLTGVLLVTVGRAQNPCVDPQTQINLESLVTADGQGMDTPFGRMVINPCRAMTNQPNVACPANSLCCMNVNVSGWESCGSAPRWMRFGEYLDARAPLAQEVTAGGLCTNIPYKELQVASLRPSRVRSSLVIRPRPTPGSALWQADAEFVRCWLLLISDDDRL